MGNENISSVVDRIVEMLGSEAVQKSVAGRNVANKFQELGERISTLRTFLVEAELRLNNNDKEEFLEVLENAVYATDEFLDDCLVVALGGNKKIATKVSNFFSISSNPFLLRLKMKKVGKALTEACSMARSQLKSGPGAGLDLVESSASIDQSQTLLNDQSQLKMKKVRKALAKACSMARSQFKSEPGAGLDLVQSGASVDQSQTLLNDQSQLKMKKDGKAPAEACSMARSQFKLELGAGLDLVQSSASIDQSQTLLNDQSKLKMKKVRKAPAKACSMARSQFKSKPGAGLDFVQSCASIDQSQILLNDQSQLELEDEDVFGIDFHRRKIMQLALEDADLDDATPSSSSSSSSKRKLIRVIPIVGVKGIGKTTLAQRLYNENAVIQHFNPRLWVRISSLTDLRLIVEELIRQSVKKEKEDDFLGMDLLQKELRQKLNGNKFLLVLDDVRDRDAQLWLTLRSLLMGGAKDSTVLVTTRSEQVAALTSTVAESLHLGPLVEEDSWLLFKRKAFPGKEEQEEEEEHIGRQIAGMCRGIPHILVRVGELLCQSPSNLWMKLVVEDKTITGLIQSQEKKDITAVLGRETDKEAIMEQLLTQDELVISICGVKGVGKTAVAHLIFNDSEVRDVFNPRIWVSVNKVHDLHLLMEKILESMTTTRPGNLQTDALELRVCQKIHQKRYLLVLDDLSFLDDESWSHLKGLLAVGANGSRIVVTTSTEDVAKATAGEQHTYHLQPLDEHSSWSLFVMVAFEEGQEPELDSEGDQEPSDAKIMNIGEKIVSMCKGIPLAIRTIGAILYHKDAETEWLSFYEENHQKTLDEIIGAFQLGYDHLPYFLKTCVVSCGLFPDDYEIDVQTLVHLWVSQGLVSTNSDSNLKDVGYGYFEELLRITFFQETMRDELGRTTKCKMHSFICDYARKVAPNTYSTLGLRGGDNSTNLRHVSFDFHLDSSWQIRLLSHSRRNIRTLILPRQSKLEVEGRSSEAVCYEVTKFKCLRLLDLHNSGIKVVPDSIGDLLHLRYLDLSKNVNIKALPKSIGKLRNLQTFKLNHCSNLQKLPKAIKNLVNLRNLENEFCCSLTSIPRELGQLTNLRTLSEFPGSASNLGALEKLNNLRGKLKIKNLRCLGGDNTTRAKLKEKQHLVSLVLIWDVSATINPDDSQKLLEDLQPPQNLRELSLSAYGGEFSSWLMRHENLVKFSLSKCSQCQSLPPLHHLPKLEILLVDELQELEYISDETFEANSAGEFFQSLKELQLTNLRKLVGWWKSEAGGDGKGTTFPCLSKLIIKDCPDLTSMPLFPCLKEELVLKNTRWKPFKDTIAAGTPLGHLSKLRTLRIANMPSFTSHSDGSFSRDRDFPDPNMFESLSGLCSLTFDHLCEIETFLKGLKHLKKLQELHIWRCANLKDISWIGNIKSLRILSLRLCPRLTISRDTIKSLMSLNVKIEECPQVSYVACMLDDPSYKISAVSSVQ